MPTIRDFENSLRRRCKGNFADWHAVDLHNHSPKSFDYKGQGGDLVERIVAQIRSTNLSIVMFTDHEDLPERTLVEEVSQKTGRLILRGVELNVFVDAWSKPIAKVQKEAFFHLLLGFDPDSEQSPEYWLSHVYRECKEQRRKVGNREMRGISSSLDELYRALQPSNALLIPAHLHSESDAFESRSIDDIYEDAEFLRHADKHFTALDVRSDKTAAFFDGRHEETGKLHKTCIKSSDSHEPETLGSRPTYVQMQDVSFGELRAALELPFRSARSKPEGPKSWIVGLHADGAFLKDLWWACSPHCNALIGVKGSGKTSVLECLRYGLGVEVPQKRKDTVAQHLDAILGPSGKVELLLRREDGAKLLVQRSRGSRTFSVTFEDDRVETFANAESFQFPAYVLGWHEIEQAAEDPTIRRIYMDTIAGRQEVRALEQEAIAIVNTIRHKHDQASERYNVFKELNRQVAELEELRKGLQHLTDSNLIQLKDEYERATEHRDQFDAAALAMRAALSGLSDRAPSLLPGIDRGWFLGDSPLSEVCAPATTVIATVFASLEGAIVTIREAVLKAADELDLLRTEGLRRFQDFAIAYDSRLAALTDEQRRLLESHRSVADKTRALPRLKTELQQKQAELEALLADLAALAGAVAGKLEDRSTLRSARVKEFGAEIAPYGVRVDVAAGVQGAGFNELTNRYRQGAEVVGKLPAAPRFHRRLKAAYEGLKGDLIAGNHVFFDYAEFGYFLDAFEEDDLKIDFDVSGGAGQFKPIDQLSAGQRCTAVFPILLRLRAGPLVIDQPEDNLDNRHIANSIAQAVLEDKKSRQIVFTSHNANLVVLSDAESITSFESSGSEGRIEQRGFLARRESNITKEVLEILDGGDRALELRYRKYGRLR